MPEFYVLRDRCLSDNGYVSHISFNAYSAVVSHTSIWHVAILFTFVEATVVRSFLENFEHECYGYDIVPFSEMSQN